MSYNYNDILFFNVTYDDGKGSKPRPALILSEKDNIIKFYKITTKYDDKSETIKKQYFEILEYEEAGLYRKSYVDTVQLKTEDISEYNIKVIGQLTEKDTARLAVFLENKKP